MTTFTILTLAAVCILVMLCGALTFAWLGGMAAGRAVGWALAVDAPTTAPANDLLSPKHIAEMDALVAESQRLLRESERRAAFSRA